MELGEAEPLRLLDDHDGGVGHIDPDLHDRRRHQDPHLPGREVRHDGVLLRRRQLPVDKPDLAAQARLEVLGPLLCGLEVQELGLADQGTDPEGLGAAQDGRNKPVLHLRNPGHGGRAGCDRRPSRRLADDPADVQVAIGGQFESAGYGRGRHGEEVNGLSLVQQSLALPDAKAMLLINDRQGQVGEPHLVLEQGMGADRNRGRAVGKTPQLLPA